MDSDRARKRYSYWFSYHLNHVHFEAKSGLHRYPWPHCDECTAALDKTEYNSGTGRFGLLSKHTQDIVHKVSMWHCMYLLYKIARGFLL